MTQFDEDYTSSYEGNAGPQRGNQVLMRTRVLLFIVSALVFKTLYRFIN